MRITKPVTKDATSRYRVCMETRLPGLHKRLPAPNLGISSGSSHRVGGLDVNLGRRQLLAMYRRMMVASRDV